MKNFYAGKSFIGLNFTYDSACWEVYMFDSKKERDNWLEENEYCNGSLVAEAISQKIAYKILRVSKAIKNQDKQILILSDYGNGKPNQIAYF